MSGPTMAPTGAGTPGEDSCGHLVELDCPGQADHYLAGFLAPG
jgi:hypothetical protein